MKIDYHEILWESIKATLSIIGFSIVIMSLSSCFVREPAHVTLAMIQVTHSTTDNIHNKVGEQHGHNDTGKPVN